jgi:hypothetical protein
MEPRKQCIAHAETCQDLAAKAKHALRRAELLELAITWKFLAEQHESLLQSRKRLAEMM